MLQDKNRNCALAVQQQQWEVPLAKVVLQVKNRPPERIKYVTRGTTVLETLGGSDQVLLGFMTQRQGKAECGWTCTLDLKKAGFKKLKEPLGEIP